MAKPKRPTQSPNVDARVEQAMADQRFQNALELARQQFKYEPTPTHRQLLHNAAIGRARQLRDKGATLDATVILKSQLDIPGLLEPMKVQIAEEMAACGEWQTALQLAGTNNPQLLDNIHAALADAAIRKQKAGRVMIPEALRADFDRILLAFDQLEAGKDDAARETLQQIGLRSPFLEWKVYLRGLQAYYQNDDTRAVENWQRLKPERLPARLAAPMRFQIDRAFQVAQPPAVQNALSKLLSTHQGSATIKLLRDLSLATGKMQSMVPVFRQAEQAVRALRQDAPHLIPRLATVFYWLVMTQGQPEDIQRYQRVFGAPADDPHFHRLEALGWERSGDLESAHKHWQQLEKEIAGRSDLWPGEQGKYARALIWQHMGRNAATVPDKEDLKLMPAFLRNHPDRPKPLKPTTEECFRQCIELMPNEMDGYRDLFKHFVDTKKPAKAIAVGKDMLKRFPDDVPMLTRLGEVQVGAQKYDDAVETFKRALKHNPLDRTLQRRLSTAHLFNARTQAEAGQYDDARQSYQLALELDSNDPSSIKCKWAACEIKAGNSERGEQLIQEALAGLGSQLSVSYSMVIEAIRLKLPAAIKKRFDATFKAELAPPVDPTAAVHLAEVTATHQQANVDYTGKKTHQKKVIDYLKKALKTTFTEEQLESLCKSMLRLDAYRLTGQYLDKARKAYPNNPEFSVLLAENEVSRGPGGFRPWTVEQELKRAQEKTQQLPPGSKRDGLLERIHTLQKMVDALNPFGRMFGDIFDPFGSFDGDEFDEGDEEF